MSYNEELHLEMFCRTADSGTLEQLGFVADPDFSATDAVLMTRAGSRPMIAMLMGLGEEGMVLFGFVTGAKHHPPCAMAADGAKLAFVPCDHATFDPIIRLTSDGRVVGVGDATAYWTIAKAAVAKLGLQLADDNQAGSKA